MKGDHLWKTIGLKYISKLSAMKIVSWNVRGAGKKGFNSQVRYLISKYDLDILALVETRVNSNRAHKIIERINLPNFVEILPKGFSGGIWLLWKNSMEFQLNLLKTQERFMH